MTMVFVTHSITEAVMLGNRILLLSPHPGRIKAHFETDGTDPVSEDGRNLSDRIHDMLFADAVEEQGEGHA